MNFQWNCWIELISFFRLKSVNFLLTDVPKIYESLERVRDENGKHSQYATAIENLKHIFTVQASVTKTQQWIEEDKLLHAHQVRRFGDFFGAQSTNKKKYFNLFSAFRIWKTRGMICYSNCISCPIATLTTR